MNGNANGRKSIFITGAASGIGRATAILFAEKGWFVGAFDVNQPGSRRRSRRRSAATTALPAVST